jgi:hypothetical protein
VVLSIGVVEFFPDRWTPQSTEEDLIGKKFYSTFNLQSQIDQGRTISADTLGWWMNQGSEARRAAFMKGQEAPQVSEVLLLLNDFIRQFPTPVALWGNGAAFDNVILTNLYNQFKIGPAYRFTSDSCYRTLKGLIPGVEPGKRVGVHHNALDDAIFQAMHACALLNVLNSSLPRGLL